MARKSPPHKRFYQKWIYDIISYSKRIQKERELEQKINEERQQHFRDYLVRREHERVRDNEAWRMQNRISQNKKSNEERKRLLGHHNKHGRKNKSKRNRRSLHNPTINSSI